MLYCIRARVQDAFIAVFNDPADKNEIQTLEFGSYFGGGKVEWDDALFHYGPDLGKGINNTLYLTFYTKSKNISNSILSDGFHFNNKLSNDNDGYLARILNDEVAGQIECANYDWRNIALINQPPSFEDSNESMLLYSNPTSGSFTLKFKNAIQQPITIEILNSLGQELLIRHETFDGELTKVVTMPSTASPGWYIVKVIMSDQMIEKKLLYQK